MAPVPLPRPAPLRQGAHRAPNPHCAPILEHPPLALAGLTSLSCSSPHGFSAGGLAHFSRLTRLERLEVADAPRAWSAGDAAALAALTGLTRLALGGGAGALRPLLERLADANGYPASAPGAEGAAAAAARRGRGPTGWMTDAGSAAIPAGTVIAYYEGRASGEEDGGPGAAPGGSGGAGGGAAGSAPRRGGRLALRELELGFDVAQAPNEQLLPSIARLTSLTSLRVRGGGVAKACLRGVPACRPPPPGPTAGSALTRARPPAFPSPSDLLAVPHRVPRQLRAPHAARACRAAVGARAAQGAAAAERRVARG
jgi:hypothetical protein